MDNKLVIIDGNSLFYRAFYALPLLSNTQGEFSNAIYGFAIQILNIIRSIRPSHMVVAFDAAKRTFRNELYADYKAFRKPMPPELHQQLAPLKRMLSLMNIKTCEQEGLEGDDIIGILSDKFDSVADTIIVTGDRDSFQLIDESTVIYFTKRGSNEYDIIDLDRLKRDFGVTPKQFIDLKALQGDKSDNIPGVMGIGPKTASELIKKFGSLEGVYARLDEIGGKVRDNLEASRELAFLSKQLAEIVRVGSLGIELDDCKYDYPFSAEVMDFFKYYDFRSLLKKENFLSAEREKEKSLDYDTKVIGTEAELDELAEELVQNKKFAIYFDADEAHICCGKGEIVIKILQNLLFEGVSHDLFFKKLGGFFEDESTLKICYDSKQIMYKIKSFGLELNNYFDIAIAKNLVDGLPVDSLLDVFESDSTAFIASNLYSTYYVYEEKIESEKLQFLFNNVEIPLSKLLFNMENAGFAIDKTVLQNLTDKYTSELVELEKNIYEMSGSPFNLNSPKQLGHVLFEVLSLPHKKNMSTSADNLKDIEGAHPIVPLILRYRKVFKFLSTYLTGMYPHISEDGKIHTYFKQTFTQTGRLSSVEPNLQNIPIRSNESREIRSMFVASDEEHVLVDADYSQIELRLLAHMSQDKKFIDAFKNDEDIHTKTASEVFKVPENLVSSEMRRTAKVVNFGIIYGISGFGLADDLKISNKEAKAFIDEFYAVHPQVKTFMDNLVKTTQETGNATTLFGRKRRVADINVSNFMVRSRAERVSQNMPLQGTAADIIKIAMLGVANSLKAEGLSSRLIMQIHDELIVDCKISERQRVEEIVRREMENAANLDVPLKVEIKSAYRWSDAH